MSTEEKIKTADEVMEKMSAALGIEFSPEQRLFNRGYLVAMMDAAEHNVQWTVGTISEKGIVLDDKLSRSWK